MIANGRAAALLAVLLSLAAQAGADEPCRDDPRFRQFDFWLGQWEVTQRGSGQRAGFNDIRATQNGCLIEEHWRSLDGSTGFSINYFNPLSGLWRQVWVADGYSIDYQGGLRDDGSMHLEGTLFDYRRGRESPFRGTWMRQDDGSVRQLFEIRGDAKDDWQVWFDGIYTHVDARQPAVEGPP